MKKSRIHIGVFDSGVGGISVWKSLRKAFPDAVIDYCSDSKNFPYGTKSDEEVIACATSTCVAFADCCKFDFLVIACGTASTIALPAIRKAITCPVVGVVPAIKPAALQSQTKCIGLLATKATVQRQYTKDLIRDFASGCEVRSYGSSLLVELAEQKIRGQKLDIQAIKDDIQSLFIGSEKKIDVIVLGCTHFPLLEEELKLASPYPVRFIDSADAIARRIDELSKQLSIEVKAEYSDRNYSLGFVTNNLEQTFPNSVPEYLESIGLPRWQKLI